MTTLTRWELSLYPGATETDRALAHQTERGALDDADSPAPSNVIALRPAAADSSARAKTLGSGPAVPATIDVRKFPGRDARERVMAWVRATTWGAEAWSSDSLAKVADEVMRKSRVIG